MGMIITPANLDFLFRGFSAAFSKGFTGAKSQYARIAMTVPSSARENTYGWLGRVPRMREWIGDRVFESLTAHGYTIVNKKFELSQEVTRDEISDDQYGLFGPLFEEMGRSAAENPDELVFALLKAGFTTPCYDNQYFFDIDHAGPTLANGTPTVVSNMQAGDGAAWYLLDTSRAIKPIIYQEREKPEFQAVTDPNSPTVFLTDRFMYGVRARHNVGFGLWQLAYASKAPLTAENYALARKAMQSLRDEKGRLLGIQPDLLVVDPSNEGPAIQVIKNTLTANGGSNEWAGTADMICVPWLD